VGNLTDQFTMISLDVDQECVRSDRLEEQVGRLESELDVEWSGRVCLTVDLSLGAGGVLPGGYIESFLRVFKQFTHTLPRGQMVGKFSMYSPL